ncbi:shikimate kinase [Sediminitomix flava]|uniref:Shikimate kinase n=1 Tax=Sediminitomix flava TaxID=379075 RepID=A0A315ZHA9_SEDFL|nr:shikimate kinase [Sediminitomix flava]PWJ44104.1 shikimate kinase [Sediminitomix flava]
MSKRRIYLVGMPGCGKSTLGKALAEKLNYTFVDLDTEIENVENRTIPQIFETEGEDYFRKVEQKVLHDNLVDNAVIATGGGAPCFFDNMDFIKNNGISIFIDADIEQLAERVLSQKGTRPLLSHAEDLLTVSKSLEEKYNARLPFYTKSDFRLFVKDKSVEKLAEEVHQWLNRDI